MPLQRFKDFDEARRALWVDSGDPDLARRIRNAWDFAARLTPPLRAEGVRRFRSIEEAARDRDERVQARIRRLRDERG